MENKKMTYVQAIDAVLNECEGLPADVVERLEALKESLQKRSAKRAGTPTKVQTENEVLIAEILDNMGEATMSISEITKVCPSLVAMDATPQKVSPLMRTLEQRGEVTKTMVKGKVHYTKA